MKNKRVQLKYKNNKFNINLKICRGICKLKGLMFSSRENAKALLFENKELTKQSIHSLFVFFSFIVIWLDDKNKIIDFKVIKPFRFFIHTKEPYKKLIEIPLNKKYSRIVELFSKINK